MFKPPIARALGARLRTFAEQTTLHQQLNVRLAQFAAPFVLVFYAAGASPMVALLAGLAVGLLAAGPRLLPSADLSVPWPYGSIYLASAAMLMVACGSQTLTWRFVLNAHQTGVGVMLGTIAVALTFLLVDGLRFSWQWVRRQI